MKKSLSTLLFFFLSTAFYSSAWSQTDLDEQVEALESAICTDNQKAERIYQDILNSPELANEPAAHSKAIGLNARMKYCTGEGDSSIYYFKKSATVALQSGDLQVSGRMLNNVAALFQIFGQLDSGLHYFDQARTLADQAGDTSLVGSTLLGKGIIFQIQGKLQESLSNYLLAEKLILNIDPRVSINARLNKYTLLLDHYPSEMDYEEVMETYELTKKQGMEEEQSTVLQFVGDYFIQQKEYLEAIKHFDEGILLSEKNGRPDMKVFLLEGKSRAYIALGDLQTALNLCLEGIEIGQKNELLNTLVQLSITTSDIYLKLDKPQKVIKYATLAIDTSEKQGQKEVVSKAYENLAYAYARVGDYKKAFQNHLDYAQKSRELLDEQKSNQLTFLQTKYETEKKDSEIASLSQQAQIQALQISQRNNQLIGAGVILLVLVLGGVVISQQRKFRHQQAVSDMEQQMLRLQMNPHFIFNALGSIQNFILQSNTKESVSYLAKFGKLMRQILEHSREEFISISEEVDMLKNYIEIQQLRFKDSFDFSIETDPSFDPEETKIPPLFAQPFVENAIEHGLKDKKADGLLSIRFKPEGSNVLLEVEDNGSGLNASANTGKDHKSLATRITKERLVIFEKKFRLTLPLKVQSQKEGTLASMLLPTIS
ncbi:MAG: histidine kinase [Cyclobacteriaceae bacterium]